MALMNFLELAKGASDGNSSCTVTACPLGASGRVGSVGPHPSFASNALSLQDVKSTHGYPVAIQPSWYVINLTRSSGSVQAVA